MKRQTQSFIFMALLSVAILLSMFNVMSSSSSSSSLSPLPSSPSGRVLLSSATGSVIPPPMATSGGVASAITDAISTIPVVSTMIVPSDIQATLPTKPLFSSPSSSSVHTPFREIGFLQDESGEKVQPLLGRPHPIRRNKWQYMSVLDNKFSTRMPVLFGGRNCTGENGCDEVFANDTVSLSSTNAPMKAVLYDTNALQYDPSIV